MITNPAETEPQLVVAVIVNYNTADLSIRCASSLAAQRFEALKVVIVDNSSAPVDRSKLRGVTGQDIDVLFLERNIGYAAGINAGIRRALVIFGRRPAYFLVVNSDVVFPEPLTVAKLVSSLKSSCNAVAASPLIHDSNCLLPPEETVQVSRVPDYKTLLVGHSGILRRLPVLRQLADRQGYSDERPYPLNQILPCETINGACFLIDYAFLDATGSFDEHTFLYMEESIIGYRIRSASRFAVLVTSTFVNHIQGATTGQSAQSFRAAMFMHRIRSECYYARAYLRASFAAVVLLRCVRIVDFGACLMGVVYRRARSSIRSRIHATQIGFLL